jgi:tetratricopeptide (TPR) repeat protein
MHPHLKNTLLLFCFNSMFLAAYCQPAKPNLLVNNRPTTFACNFFDRNTQYIPPPAAGVKDAAAEVWMRGMINKICEITGLQNRFLLKALKNYDNCSAICFSNDVGQDRYIQFDRDFLEEYQRKTKNKWFVFGVLAHEIGHHLNGHSLDGVGSRPHKELEADEFAGFVMQKMGAPLVQAQRIFSFLNETDGPPTHPVKKLRYEAIKRGWDKAAGKITYETLRFNDADMVDFAQRALYRARKERRVDSKIKDINAALEFFPEYAEALSEKGLYFMEKNNFDSAYHYCERAIELEPYIGLLRLNLAKVQYYNKEMEASAKSSNLALYLKPVFPEAYLFLAQVAFDKKDYEDAKLQTELALRMNPESRELRADIAAAHAIALYHLGKYAEAADYMAAAKELDPENFRVKILYDDYMKKAEEMKDKKMP